MNLAMDEARKSPAPEPEGRLIRAAGSRLEPPRERRERIRAAVHAAWLPAARARQRRRYIFWAIGSTAAALIALAVLPAVWRMVFPASGEVLARVERAAGDVELVRHGAVLKVQAGDELRLGDCLFTPLGVRASLVLASGTSLRVDAGSRLRALGPGCFELEAGAVYVDSGTQAGSGGPVEIVTALGNTRDIGTQFEVRLASELVVRVREGKVELSRGSEVVTAKAGEQLTAPASAAVTRAEIPVTGQAWDWATELAPAFKMDGRRAAECFAWICREKGWTLAYADAKAEAAARAAILHGELAGTTPEATLEAVLAISNLAATTKDGVLTVALSN